MRKSIISVGEGTVVYESKFNQVISFPFENTLTKKKGVWEVVKRKNAVGMITGILGITPNLEAILIKTFRIPLDNWIIQHCYGGANAGETEQEAACRELVEETGYKAKSATRLFTGPFNPALVSDQLVVFLGLDCQKIHEGKRDVAEDIEVLLVPLKEALMVLHDWSAHTFVDIKLWGAVYAARELLLKK